jgi:hypothetical protein
MLALGLALLLLASPDLGSHGLLSGVAAAVPVTPAPLPTPLFGLGAVAYGGKIYAIGSGRVEIYDPATNSWSTGAPMPVATTDLAVVLLGDAIYAVGGANGEFTGQVTTLQRYDPVTDTWALKAPMSIGRAQLAAAAIDGKLYVFGGYRILPTVVPGWYNGELPTTVEEYDPVSDTWRQRAPLPEGRVNHGAVAANNGKIYVIGGSKIQLADADTAMLEYSPNTDSWATKHPLPDKRKWFSSVVVGDTIYVLGGRDVHETPQNTTFAYSVTSDSWMTRSPMSFAISATAAAAGSDNRIFIVGGTGLNFLPGGGYTYYDKGLQIYNPATDLWLPDTVPPSIQGFTIDFGAEKTNSTTAILSIQATDNYDDLADVSLSINGWQWSAPQPFSSQIAWTLPGGDGPKTVFLQVRDGSGNVSAVASDTIVLDTVAGTALLTVNSGQAATNSLSASLSLQSADPASDVAEMRFSNTNNCADWSAWEPYGTAKTWPLAPGGDGARTVYAQVRDSLGNVSPAFSDAIVYDTAAPALSSLAINGGALVSTSSAVNLDLPASDVGSGVAEMAFSNDGGNTWSAWEAYAPTKSWTLAPGDGAKTVQARVRDAAGNISSTASASITVDTSLGSDFGISIDHAAVFTNTIDVTLSLIAPPGTTQMQVSNDGGFVGAAWEPFATSKPWQITQYGAAIVPRTVYARFRDSAGNVSYPIRDDIILDLTAPTGSVSLPSTGAGATASGVTRTIRLAASDDLSTPAQMSMRLSNRADFAGAIWKPFATSTSWDFSGGGTVYAQFRDGAGNISQTYSQTLPGSSPPGTSPTVSCSPRPPVQVTLQKSNGTLVATLATTGASNGLRAVRFDTFSSASVDVGSQTGQTQPFAVSLPAGQEPTSLQFTVRRTPGAQSATVRLVVIDGCGEWSTFVGGGPSAW